MEANAISENTETLQLSPAVTTAYEGPGVEERPGVCARSCEELGSMASELSGLRLVVNQLHENLRKVVGAGPRLRPDLQSAPTAEVPSPALAARRCPWGGGGHGERSWGKGQVLAGKYQDRGHLPELSTGAWGGQEQRQPGLSSCSRASGAAVEE